MATLREGGRLPRKSITGRVGGKPYGPTFFDNRSMTAVPHAAGSGISVSMAHIRSPRWKLKPTRRAC